MENPDEILTHVSNRYYPLPPKPWLLYQEWHQVLLLHWKIDPKLLLRLIPEHLQLDTFDGSAYISIIAFNVENFRSSAGKLPFISSFQEINVRTYVTCNGIKGIYFFFALCRQAFSGNRSKTVLPAPVPVGYDRKTGEGVAGTRKLSPVKGQLRNRCFN